MPIFQCSLGLAWTGILEYAIFPDRSQITPRGPGSYRSETKESFLEFVREYLVANSTLPYLV